LNERKGWAEGMIEERLKIKLKGGGRPNIRGKKETQVEERK